MLRMYSVNRVRGLEATSRRELGMFGSGQPAMVVRHGTCTAVAPLVNLQPLVVGLICRRNKCKSADDA